jgi:hypothetical protein
MRLQWDLEGASVGIQVFSVFEAQDPGDRVSQSGRNNTKRLCRNGKWIPVSLLMFSFCHLLINNFWSSILDRSQFASYPLVQFALQIGPFRKIMHCQRRFAKPITTIVILILLSVLAVVSLGEGLKLLVIRRDGVKLRKRDGSTITFDLPWKYVTSLLSFFASPVINQVHI